MQFEIQGTKNVAYISFLISTIVLVAFATTLLFDKTMSINKVFGQSPESSSSPSSPISVKIVDPDKGQTTSFKNSLEISGVSEYEPSYSCQVSVIVNNVKPYQKTSPVGVRTDNDYSTWKYKLNPNYTSLREGDNRITARLICSDDQGKDMRKWYSVNVIGEAASEKGETLSIPTSTESKSGLSKTTIEIDRNVFIDLINDRIGNNTEAIRDTIENSIMYVYKEQR
jgi:hypothetical protein